MSTVTVFTSMTNPDERKDPWKQALNCYEDLADDINIIGQKFPEEFKWDYFGKIFQDAFNSSKGDWVFRMDVDYFFHEKNLSLILDKAFIIYPIKISISSSFISIASSVNANVCSSVHHPQNNIIWCFC